MLVLIELKLGWEKSLWLKKLKGGPMGGETLKEDILDTKCTTYKLDCNSLVKKVKFLPGIVVRTNIETSLPKFSKLKIKKIMICKLNCVKMEGNNFKACICSYLDYLL